jgi:hypothetical protein
MRHPCHTTNLITIKLVAGRWSLVAGRSPLATRRWPLAAGHSPLADESFLKPQVLILKPENTTW